MKASSGSHNAIRSLVCYKSVGVPAAVRSQIAVFAARAFADLTAPRHCRLWWNDARLQYAGPEDGGCVKKMVFLDGPAKLWVPLDEGGAILEHLDYHRLSSIRILSCANQLGVGRNDSTAPVQVPDFYFPLSGKQSVGAKYDGQQMDVYPNGDVYWSNRLRMTGNCKMNFQQMPWDEQRCGIIMGSYSQSAAEVNFQWKPGRVPPLLRPSPPGPRQLLRLGTPQLAMDKLADETNAQWEIGVQTQSEVRVDAGCAVVPPHSALLCTCRGNPYG